jgi:hypothetical protein
MEKTMNRVKKVMDAEKKTAPSRNGEIGDGFAPSSRPSPPKGRRSRTAPSGNGEVREGSASSPRISPTEGRGSDGKFAKGNAGGPGNPFARQTAALRSAILRFMTPEKIEELVEVIYEQALQGDMRAAKLILSYSVGQPRPAVDPDRLDVEEMDLFGKQARTPEEFDKILYSPTARMMCMLLQTMVPGFEKEALGKLAAGIQQMDERDKMTAGGAGQAARSQAEPGNEGGRRRQETEKSEAVQAPSSLGSGGQSRRWHPSYEAGKEKDHALREIRDVPRESTTGAEAGATNVHDAAGGGQAWPGGVTAGHDQKEAPPSINGEREAGKRGGHQTGV